MTSQKRMLILIDKKPRMVKVIQYTGSIESYNEFVDHMWDGDEMYIWFLDEDGEMTPRFTGVVVNAKTGMRYKPGDSYVVEIGDLK
jgi:hypothetical protein